MSEDGRIMLINLAVENNEFTLINVHVYSPNSPKERKCFFNKIGKWISNFSTNSEVIIGGDFILTENQKDRVKSNMQYQYCDISVGPYKSLMKNYNLKDIWREMHPEKLQYTYREIRRLDKFLVSEYLTSHVQASNILHSTIKLIIKVSRYF